MSLKEKYPGLHARLVLSSLNLGRNNTCEFNAAAAAFIHINTCTKVAGEEVFCVTTIIIKIYDSII
jgi:hypothetical protein